MLVQRAQKQASSAGSNINNNTGNTPTTYPWKLSSRYQKRRSSFPGKPTN